MKNLSREEKIEIMKKILKEADNTGNFEKAKKEFTKLLKNTDSEEIAGMEQSLISEGYPIEKIQNLCDLHVSVFESSLKKQGSPHKMPGHPIHTFIMENKELKRKLKNLVSVIEKLRIVKKKEDLKKDLFNILKKEFESLKEIDKHYLRKENQLFPYLEQKNFTGPSKVMWAKDDEIRAQIKEISFFLNKDSFSEEEIIKLYTMIKKLKADMFSMIFKEEKILFPVSTRKISEEEWLEIKNGENHIGYSWIIPGSLWDAYAIKKFKIQKKDKKFFSKEQNKDKYNDKKIFEEKKCFTEDSNERIRLDTGSLSLFILNSILKKLPVDISFIDENDRVAYYSDNPDRIFPRSPAVIGREVQNCHPQKSLEKVNKIIETFKKGEKDHYNFWIDLHGKFIYIRYFAVRDKNGKYLGTLEVSQDITEIKKLEGEKRLLD